MSTTIRIVHNRTEGTLLEGSRKGDGVWDIVRTIHGWRWSRHVGIYVRNSRDRAADRWTIDRAAEALRAAGYTVDVEVDDVTAGPSFAEREAERNERAEDRVDRYAGRAARNTAAGHARWERTRDRMSHVPPGQPILVGHHSERGHRRLLDWAHTQDGRAVEELRKGAYWAGRARAAENYRAHREDVGTTRRRLDKLAKERRRIADRIENGWEATFRSGEQLPDSARLQHTYSDGSRLCRVLPTGDRLASLQADLDRVDDEIGYWEEILERAAANGVHLWSKADFAKGDYVIVHDTAVEVMRVNTKSLSIPWAHYWICNGPVVTVAWCQEAHQGGGRMYTDTVPYDKVQGKVTAAELEGLTKAQARDLVAAKMREARGETAEAAEAGQG
jgi:hypothetical protein